MGRSTKTELFLIAASHLVSDDPVYNAAHLARYVELVRRCAVDDPEWTARLLRWVRHEADLVSSAFIGAAEFVAARRAAGQHGLSRQVVDSVLRQADEPGWLLAYWNHWHGRTLPKPLKRGVADAVRRLYTERSLLAHDGSSLSIRFGDVLARVHPAPVDAHQAALFSYAVDRRYRRNAEIPAELAVVRARAALSAVPVRSRRLDAAAVADGGITWVSVHGWLKRQLTAAEWEVLLPTMTDRQLLRSLPELEQAGLGDVRAPAGRSVPRVPGHTLVLIDTAAGFERGADLLASNCEHAQIVRWRRGGGFLRRDDVVRVIRKWFRRHDRVVVVTGEQDIDGPLHRAVPRSVPLHVWSLGRSGPASVSVPNRYCYDGLSESAFRAIGLLETGEQGLWPF
ncbi:hypothetical protein FKR81_27770 [Lentzea tibetensis]|uniref:TROVE domain-containing protein n=1 Tax=Lentzea tibetensis TaxID=2591470 RepID=A0A563ENV3_9PSEU|nr:hypothetical protein [Lentzea tibetensis]TWP48714.1 hypothetical protein FKR81_27770 [Lentzea tibetensis]